MMTLIVSCADAENNQKGSFIAASDILISDNFDHPGDKNILPLQYGVIVEQSSTLARRTSSKAVVFDRYLLQWAGSVATAAILIDELKKKKPNSSEEFYSLFDEAVLRGKKVLASHGISEHYANISGILNFFDGDAGWSAQRSIAVVNVGSIHVAVAGSGEEAFLKEHKLLYEKSSKSVFYSVVPAIFNLSVQELTEKGHSWDVYGGGYEFFGLKEGGGFRRLCYSICEVSHYDHVNSLYVSGWFVSRIIQCIPMNGGSRFQTALLSHPKPFAQDIFQDFDVLELGCSELTEIDRGTSGHFDFGACLVIDKHALTSIAPKPIASFRVVDKLIKPTLNEGKIQELLNKYVDKHGADIEVKCDDDLNYLTCSKCGRKSSQMNYSTLKDEDGNTKYVLHLCNNCK